MPSRPPWRRPFILIPLYIYPSADSWGPLFSAVMSHPSLDFVTIVNPDNGPGCTSLPDQNYMKSLRKLSSFSNVTIVGYVYCSYGERALAEMESDIRAYCGWVSQRSKTPKTTSGYSAHGPDTSLRLDGIFFDEVPSADQHIDYMASASHAARMELRRINAASVVIYNPGIFVGPPLYNHADFVVVFENAAAEWSSNYVRKNMARLPETLRGRSIGIAHSLDCVEEQVQFTRDVVSAGFAGHFATTTLGYTRFCPNWEGYVRHADESGRTATGESVATLAPG